MADADVKQLPFSVARDRNTPIHEQVARGLVRAIRSGYYQPGDRLPGIAETSAQLGISHMPVRQAVASLAADGEIIARRRHGIHVRDAGQHYWRSHVLLVHYSYATYYFAARNHQLEMSLRDNRIRMSRAAVHLADAADAFPQVTTILDGEHIDLAVIAGPPGDLVSLFTSRNVPFIAESDGTGPVPHASASWLFTDAPALEELAGLCVGHKMRSVAIVGAEHAEALLFRRLLSKGGVDCMLCAPAQNNGETGHERQARQGWEIASGLLASPGRRPELIYFADDYLARGGLAAVLATALRVPEQLQIVVHCNRGDVPFFPTPLTRIEPCPDRHGRALASLALAALAAAPQEKAKELRVDAPLVHGATTRFAPTRSARNRRTD